MLPTRRFGAVVIGGGCDEEHDAAHLADRAAFRRCRSREICAHLEVATGGRTALTQEPRTVGRIGLTVLCLWRGCTPPSTTQPRATPIPPGRPRGFFAFTSTFQP